MTMRVRGKGSSKKGNNLVYGLRYARVVFSTWSRERAAERKHEPVQQHEFGHERHRVRAEVGALDDDSRAHQLAESPASCAYASASVVHAERDQRRHHRHDPISDELAADAGWIAALPMPEPVDQERDQSTGAECGDRGHGRAEVRDAYEHER